MWKINNTRYIVIVFLLKNIIEFHLTSIGDLCHIGKYVDQKT